MLFAKLAIWLISFPINVVIVTYLYATEYISTMFNLPTDIWEQIEEEIEEDVQP